MEKRKLRFKTLFSRMLFLQFVGAAAILLAVLLTVLTVYVQQKLKEKRELLTEKGDIAAAAFQRADGGAEELEWMAKEHDLLIQEALDVGGKSYCGNESWEALSQVDRGLTAYGKLYGKASATSEYSLSYFKGGKGFLSGNGGTAAEGFPVLTMYRAFSDEGSSGLLLVHCDISDIKAETAELVLWLLLILLVGVIITVLVSYYSAYRVINPFVEMNHIVQCYSKGDFSKRLPAAGKDEASQLARSFNEMAEQLKDLEATRRSFVANVSHELRSPLTSMKGFLEAMYDGTIPKEEHEHYLEVVLSETRRLTDMVNDLLDLARIESGTIVLQYSTFDVNELVRRTLITFEARIVEKQLNLDIRFAQEQNYVHADPNQISQVLRNLIDNAIKYSPRGKALVISTYAMRKDVFVSIRDNGVGIPREDLPHVFDRFYKVEKAHTPSPQVGSGLGLSIVKRIIEQHGQTITVQSARGRGTQFTFTLAGASAPRRTQDGGRRNV